MNLNATLFAQCIVFFVLALFTMKFVWPPIMQALEDRAKKIADGLAAAEKAKKDLSVVEQKVAEELRSARLSASDYRSGAEKEAAQMIEQARSESAKIIAQAKQQASLEADAAIAKAKDSLRAQVATLAITGAEKILQREIDAKVHAELLSHIAQEL